LLTQTVLLRAIRQQIYEISFAIQLTHPALIAFDTLMAVLMFVVWTAAARPIIDQSSQIM
jgi:hypothetical protein